jgi:hypothetical protein
LEDFAREIAQNSRTVTENTLRSTESALSIQQLAERQA